MGKPRRRVPRGGLVTGGVVLALVAAMGFTVLGLGVADNAVANYDASSWLWSRAKSEVARVNGLTGRVDTRVEVAQARNHAMQVTQTDRFLILRDLTTGQISSLDLATLQVMATTRTTSGLGVSVALQDDAAFVVDAPQGVVRQLDPRSLVPIGEPVRYPPGISGGTFDGAGRLWVAVPSEGTVSAITPAPLPSAPADPLPTGGAALAGVSQPGGSGGGISPTQVKTVTVADPSHDLAVSTLDDGVAVLDRTTGALTTVRGEREHQVILQLPGAGAVPPRTNGDRVPVTVAEGRHVVVVGEGGPVSRFVVPGQGAQLRPAVAWAGRFYCADERSGTVHVFDERGQLVETIEVKGANGPLELEVRENYLFINAPNSSTARVVDDKHQVRVVDKYADDVLGGDPPKDPPLPPPPKKDVVSKPGAPRAVTATAGDKVARVSWRAADANGSAITKYVVEGGPQPLEVGARQRSVEIGGLTNGETYRFAVHAVNGKGAGPAKRSNPVMPTAEVPDPPAAVTAEARPDGTVRVSWPAADGQGNRIAKYSVTAASAGATAPAGETAKTELVVPAGELEYGTQYAFTVVAVSDKGAASKPSTASDTVVPFTVPGQPAGIAAVAPNEPGTVTVSWQPPADNGRPILEYVVKVNGQTLRTPETSYKITGLAEGQPATVSVTARNEAGEGPAATDTATTIAKPTVTLGAARVTSTTVTVPVTVNTNGSPTQCQVTISYGGRSVPSGWRACGDIALDAWRAGTAYSYVASARNAAGQVDQPARSATTTAVNGVVTCNDSGGTYCDTGIGIYTGTRQVQSESPGTAQNGTRFQAWCKKTGTNIRAVQYNGNKASTWWVQITFRGDTTYIPFAWFNLDNGDNINGLPTCV
ncbi:fibronectin type III domain-containing protein [Asanoa sp. WMMD1127]|uniref:fibronectin type III domain-containing protein n=1 Tax=Asanoa sp. WMMD1127 TaxID=3016107 RepID=UPI002416611A|nr:fibronectin type III domain-containing protein [Asanoa sp. WMMD1127]MDG4826641.1 fibronectin type III domain-containing protein [Asanoa sp. WMMD1127]